MKGSTVPIRKNRPSVLVWKGLAWERKTEDWLAPVSGVVSGKIRFYISRSCMTGWRLPFQRGQRG